VIEEVEVSLLRRAAALDVVGLSLDLFLVTAALWSIRSRFLSLERELPADALL
jgi:hypothetical protein